MLHVSITNTTCKNPPYIKTITIKSLYSYKHIFYTNTIIHETCLCLTNNKSLTCDSLRTKMQKEVTKGI